MSKETRGLDENMSAYTSRDLNWAVSISAVLGWLVFSVWTLGGHLGMLLVAAIVGLPIAFLMCWIVVRPILKRLMRRPLGWFRTAGWGAIITALIAVIGIAIDRFRGWRLSRDPNSFVQLGGGEYTRSIDGILTPYGWWILAQNTAVFILFGVVIALILRAIIGPGNRESRPQK